jgi:arylsulfatase A-like enzyme
MTRPNVIFVFGDQWRAQAVGYSGEDPNVKTPHIDALSRESLNVTNAVAGCPVCSPYRASLLTGQYPLRHRVIVNDVFMQPDGPTLAEVFRENGYATAYLGKWHLHGQGRTAYIPKEHRLGFEYWKVLECTHEYNHSAYYAGDSEEKLFWEGYDAIAQTHDAAQYIRDRDPEKPFLLLLSWGPPHNPYDAAPEAFKRLYDPEKIVLRPNVPDDYEKLARTELAGYYAHCSALDACVGDLLRTLREQGLEENTLLVFTSDHGDMLGSQGQHRKQRPWDESIRVPFLLRYPARFGHQPRRVEALLDAPDIMPTLLGLAGLPIPASVEGRDFTACLDGGADPSGGEALIMCPHTFGEFKAVSGGREYRGLRTNRYTYVRSLQGPWLLYDNAVDPYQMQNLVDDPAHAGVRRELDVRLQRRLDALGDRFRPSAEYIREFGYIVDAHGTIPK